MTARGGLAGGGVLDRAAGGVGAGTGVGAGAGGVSRVLRGAAAMEGRGVAAAGGVYAGRHVSVSR